ncbi:chloroquine resistance marker protein [Anoxybacillus flavithermus NBRC 109594]|uniref:Chloroquine resistance marker protein n=1 Tax=Anoxybacillus flavithermus NBRC 109594 TaxID=1315967 RepID=R4FAP6_9BACL|nr:chloroquine resistance marker protein [Anoxybacillus flavithermus NBRC 109594]
MIEHPLFSNEMSSPGSIVVFTAIFLIIYMFHLFISWLHYMIANKMTGSMKKKIIVFDLLGLVLLLIVYVFLQVEIVWLLFLSFVFLSFPSCKRG